MSELVETVRRRLARRATGPLPDSYRRPMHDARPTRRRLRSAAVLVPIIVEKRAEERLLLTRRARSLRHQPGDIAFPGGSIDAEDPSPLAAALRESREEVGLVSEDVTVLGQMDERETVTGFRLTPFVASVEGPYPFRTNHEVDALLEVPIQALTVPGVAEIEKRRLPDGSLRDVYHYQFEGHDIWGITGQIIKEFLELLEPAE